jgi:hypothetical protein
MLAFVVYRVIVGVWLGRWAMSSTVPPPTRLLLLRVFGAPRYAEPLFDAVSAQWRFDGTVNLIGGEDLAARTLDPGELLAFLGGRLQSQFVRSDADLRARIADLDEARDPDGRFRINDFFCFDDTWRSAVQALLGRSDVVLMDLRGFSRRNAGCQFEVGKLAENGLLPRTLFVLDDQSDEALLRATVAGALVPMGVTVVPEFEVARITGSSGRHLRQLVTSLRARVRPAA